MKGGFEPATLESQVEHSTTEPKPLLRSAGVMPVVLCTVLFSENINSGNFMPHCACDSSIYATSRSSFANRFPSTRSPRAFIYCSVSSLVRHMHQFFQPILRCHCHPGLLRARKTEELWIIANGVHASSREHCLSNKKNNINQDYLAQRGVSLCAAKRTHVGDECIRNTKKNK